MPRPTSAPKSAPAKPAAAKPARAKPAAAKKSAAPRSAAEKATPSSAAGASLAIGARAPDFRLASDQGADVSLGDFTGKWLVLYFYPKDSTPGCTREALAFQASLAALKKAGAAVVGVPRDSIASHGRFRAAQGLSFPLLSDPDAAVHRAYGAYGEKTMYGKKIVGALRATVLVAPDGTVARAWPSVKVDGHADQVLAALAELRGGA
jgi:peroxiredoxin Q/BCP